MRNIKKVALGITIGLSMMIAVNVLPHLAKKWCVYLSGAVMVNASRTNRYTDKPVRILSVTGEKWATWDKMESGSAYHVLIVLPVVIPDDDGFVSGGDGFTHTNIEMLRPSKGQFYSDPTEVRQLAVTYNAVWKTITVGSQTYRLRSGNLFVVRFDENWQSKVTQLEETIDRVAGADDVINIYKKVLSEDKTVQQL